MGKKIDMTQNKQSWRDESIESQYWLWTFRRAICNLQVSDLINRKPAPGWYIPYGHSWAIYVRR
jgi:hypothetical protein